VGKLGSSPYSALYLPDVSHDLVPVAGIYGLARHVLRINGPSNELGMAGDHAENVIEVVGDTTRQLTDTFKSMSPFEQMLDPLALCSRLGSYGPTRGVGRGGTMTASPTLGRSRINRAGDMHSINYSHHPVMHDHRPADVPATCLIRAIPRN
jgi:hypothetical protein